MQTHPQGQKIGGCLGREGVCVDCKGVWKNRRDPDMLIILRVVISCVHAYVQTYQVVHLNYVLFIVCQL